MPTIIEEIVQEILKLRLEAVRKGLKPPVLAVYIDHETNMEMKSQLRGQVSAWAMELIDKGVLGGYPVYLVTRWGVESPEPHGWKVLEIG